MGDWSRVQVRWVLGASLCASIFLAGCDGNSQAGAATPPTSQTPTSSASGGLNLPPEPATITPAPSPVGLTEANRVSVYARVIGILLERDLGTRFIYLSPYIGQGEHLDNPDVDTPVPSTLIEKLESLYRDRQFEVRDFSEATQPLEEGGRVKNEGIFITLGPITNDSTAADAVSARASYYRGFGDARGDLYLLARDNSAPDGWKLLSEVEEWNDKTIPEP